MKPAGGGPIGGKGPGDGGMGPAGGGGGMGPAGAGRAAGKMADKAVQSAIAAKTFGVGGVVYGMLPKPHDTPKERSKKIQRLVIIGGGGTGVAAFAILMVITVALALFSAIFGAAGGGGGAAASAAEQGECIDIGTPRVTQGGSGPGATLLGAPLDEQYMNVTSGFGGRDLGGGASHHDGLDLAAEGVMGAPIYAVADGEVTQAGPVAGYGNWVVLRHDLDGETVDTLYGHMENGTVYVNAGDTVKAGDHIADVGSAGQSTGPHLHFGVYPGGWAQGQGVDPLPWLDKFRARGEDNDRAESTDDDRGRDRGSRRSGGTLDASKPMPPLPEHLGTEEGWREDTTQVARIVADQWGDDLDTVHGYRETPAGGPDGHSRGVALDIMIPDYRSEAGIALGDEINDFLLANADELNLEYTIWRKMYFPVGGEPSPYTQMAGDDTVEHYDHIHAELNDAESDIGGVLDLDGVSPYRPSGPATSQQISQEQAHNATAIIQAVKDYDGPETERASVIALTLAGQATNLISEPGEDGGPMGVYGEQPLGDRGGDRYTDPYKATIALMERLERYAETDPEWARAQVADVIVGMMPERASYYDQYGQWENTAIAAVQSLWDEKYNPFGIWAGKFGDGDTSCTQGVVNANLATGEVPPEYVEILLEAGETCDAIDAPHIAAIAQAESGWQTDATSPAAARGMTQFIDSTWAVYGVDSGLDHQGNPESGTTPPDQTNPYDAILSTGNYLCAIADTLRDRYEAGELEGDFLDLVTASYNAGEHRIFEYGGIPPFSETMAYVPKVREFREQFTDGSGLADTGKPRPGLDVTGGSDVGRAVVAIAEGEQGFPYVWGGGNIHGASTGINADQAGMVGFDCSGLVQYAVYKATDGKVTTPRVTGELAGFGEKVPVDKIEPGDIIFSNSGKHVSIWKGDGHVVEAFDFGHDVEVRPFDLANAEQVRRMA